MHPARLAAGLVALGSFLAPVGATADRLLGTRFDAEERAHTVEVRLDRGFARLVVQRTLVNSGPRSDQAILHLDLPSGAVATGLRTSGLDTAGRPVWFEGDLMDADRAASEYRELTGFGQAFPKDPALLFWRGLGSLTLQVFPVPARGSKTVEYTLLLPMRYVDGKYAVDLPQLGTTDRAAVLHLTAAHAEDRVQVNGVALTAGGAVEASREMAIELSPGSGPRLSASLAAVSLSAGRVFVHERAVAAARLGEVPAHAALAVVLDVSRSMRGVLDAELVTARAYVSRFHDAAVTVVTFDRKVSVPFGASLSEGDALARLQTFEPQLGNGSQLDDALRRADDILSLSPASTRRILVLTDLRARDALTPARFGALGLKSGALLHLSTVEAGGTSLARDDDSPWATLPRKTGGVFWHAWASGGGPQAREVFEEWARPKRLDHLRVTGFPESVSAPDSLDEGHDLEFLGIASSQPGAVTVAGELWSTPVTVRAASTPEEEQRWSALVFGSNELGELTPDEQRVLALRGRAVSPVTSYLAIEPGVRPSTEGLDDDEVGIGEGAGGIGHGSGFGSMGSIGSGRGRFDERAFLETELGRAWGACGGAGRAEIHFESTLAEVVDVGSAVLDPPSPKVEGCMREAEWGLQLPEGFREEHELWTIRIDG